LLFYFLESSDVVNDVDGVLTRSALAAITMFLLAGIF
jgi:hypothetical protein